MPKEDLKLIKRTGSVNIADDSSYPYKLYCNFAPPEFMNVAFVMLYGGSEEVIVRSKTRESLGEFIDLNNFKKHPRLRRMEITGPNNLIENFTGCKG